MSTGSDIVCRALELEFGMADEREEVGDLRELKFLPKRLLVIMRLGDIDINSAGIRFMDAHVSDLTFRPLAA